MTDNTRPATPPGRSLPKTSRPAPITPEQVRRMEESRLKAKALREQTSQATSNPPTRHTRQTTSSFTTASNTAAVGQKRSHGATLVPTSTVRDARNQPNSNNGLATSQDTDIRAAKKFQRFVEYDFSKMTDTKGGFMTAEDDPHNKALHAADREGLQKPAGMTLKEWEQAQLRKKLRERREGPYEPGLSVLDGGRGDPQAKSCAECASPEIDWHWDELLRIRVCSACKERVPEKYSLLTKTEAKEDYLLTDPELRDEELLPHLEKPNPHSSAWHPMSLYLRCQVEAYAFSAAKWGSAEGLDEEYARRMQEAKDRKEKKFGKRLGELKKKTRVEAYKRARAGGGGEFGDAMGPGRHVHVWGEAVEDVETGQAKRRCEGCGMEVEEMEF